MFNDYVIFGSNNQHIMLDFTMDNSVLIYKDNRGNISNNHVIIVVTFKIPVTVVYNEVIANIQYQLFLLYLD